MAADKPVKNALPPVCAAARNGDVTALRELIDGGASVTAAFEMAIGDHKWDSASGYRPLHLATAGGHVACLALILEQPGVDVNEVVGPQFDFMTALHIAANCKDNTAELCRMLIDKGADINSKESVLGRTPLHFACKHADAEVIRLLVCEQTFLNLSCLEDRMTPTFPHSDAIDNNNRTALRVLYQFEAQCSVKLRAKHRVSLVCEAAVSLSSDGLFQEIFENYADAILPENYSEIFEEACRVIERVKYLLNKGLRPIACDSESCRALFSLLTAVTDARSVAVLDLILEHISPSDVNVLNSNVNNNDNHPLTMSYLYSSRVSGSELLDRFAKLLKLGLDPRRAVTQHVGILVYSFCLHDYNGAVLMLTNIPFSCLSYSLNAQGVARRRQFTGSFSALTNPIFLMFNDNFLHKRDIVVEMVRLLLNNGASPNASRPDEIPPLLALIWSANRLNFKEGKPLKQVFDLLVEFGVKPGEATDNSPFSSPDIAVAAACTGNEIVLQHFLQSGGEIEPLTLLWDLMKLEFTFVSTFVPTISPRIWTEHELRLKLRSSIGFSVRTLLTFTDLRAADLVGQLYNRFTDPIPLAIVERADNNEIVAGETPVWREVEELVSQTSRLKHLCRITIRRLLTAGEENRRDVNAAVASLHLPAAVREYLTFQIK